MSKGNDKYTHPLTSRYASEGMSKVWSPMTKFSTWRRLWIALATAEKELGLKIDQKQIDQMKSKINDIDFEYARAQEKKLRHDVMSHIHTFAKACPDAAPIIHLGATSCFITDNTELTQIKSALNMIELRLVRVISELKKMVLKYKDMPTLGFTHYQPAQLTTVGKRATLWLQDFLMDLHALTALNDNLPFRGVKGTTGTQASYLALFNGDHKKVKTLDKRVAELMGFSKTIPVSGQTYTRKIDFQVTSVLSGIAQSANKMANDIRLLMNLRELEEPFGKSQVGSSAMAYKRNPMRSERVCSLARYVISLTANTAHTHATQWFERTLDDSANRRMVLPESFLAVDSILLIITNVVSGIHVWPHVIQKRVMEALPFMATENILMACVKKGGNRQDLHEAIREHSMEAAKVMKDKGGECDLLSRIAKDESFKAVHATLNDIVNPKLYTGRSSQQAQEFIDTEVEPVLKKYSEVLEKEEKVI
mmetsp:Transcript_8690/g.12963  ORF Transcript_8690/g.12963 Transcript_8690/m.12963 type:complete len:479 (-) Transcript_8690:7-1443(-)